MLLCTGAAVAVDAVASWAGPGSTRGTLGAGTGSVVCSAGAGGGAEAPDEVVLDASPVGAGVAPGVVVVTVVVTVVVAGTVAGAPCGTPGAAASPEDGAAAAVGWPSVAPADGSWVVSLVTCVTCGSAGTDTTGLAATGGTTGVGATLGATAGATAAIGRG
jgi:hypothetical protein